MRRPRPLSRRCGPGTLLLLLAAAVLVSTIFAPDSRARNPFRKDFFAVYPEATGSALDDLPSAAGHCGVCHFDFNGSGQRNPFGLAVEVGLNNGLSATEAILAVTDQDSDGDGYSNRFETTDLVNFTNTPTFPGYSAGNYQLAYNVDIAEVLPSVTPAGATDTIPPTVTLLSPNGGEIAQAESYFAVSFSADDPGGLSHIDVYFSGDGGATWMPVAGNEPPGTGYSWFVPNRPGPSSRIRVVAWDNAGNPGVDESDAGFTIEGRTDGAVPTTMRDMDMTGTQPHEGAILDDPDLSCATCHGNYDEDHEAWFNWRGSMMGQAARDPFFFACMAIAEQDAPSVGDLCIRCHSPGGWQEGRSTDTSGDLLNVKDRHGVQCDFCHRMVDHVYDPGIDPVEDEPVLAGIDELPLAAANGQFINDPAPIRRGPYADAQAAHQFVESPFHRSADLCGVCHDVSSPVYSRLTTLDYGPNPFDQVHPDMDVRNMFPIERTYSEWSESEYASTGVHAPQFAGSKPDGIVSTCQDCHMRDAVAKGAAADAQTRDDLALHDFTGGNTFVPDIIHQFYPDEVDAAQLADAKERARDMLRLAATVEVTPEDFGVTVRVTNETGHKLPSGYPEGRRMWLNVRAIDAAGQTVYESGAYEYATADLLHDTQIKVYEIHPGISPALSEIVDIPAGKSFHFVLNDTIYSDNRIPPRGFTNTGFESIQSPPVDYAYADGQYWDETPYRLPQDADSVIVTLFYQSTSKEYVEFLRDENRTNSAGQTLYDAWVAQGMNAPETMATARAAVNVTVTDAGDGPAVPFVYALAQNYPNPFNPVTTIAFSLAGTARVRIASYDAAGRRVRVLLDERRDAGRYRVSWDGRDDDGRELASGIYFLRYDAGGHRFTKKAVLLR